MTEFCQVQPNFSTCRILDGVFQWQKWDWWAHSDQGLIARVVIGALILSIFAWVDWRKNGAAATRWREYLFLVAAAVVAMGYGLVNDLITSTISWEYFFYGKGLIDTLGPTVPPDGWALHRAAAVVGMRASWTVGLVAGVALLFANNPRAGKARLSYRRLVGFLPLVIGVTAACAAVLGVAGYFGRLAFVSRDFMQMVHRDEFRPYRFMAVWGIHLGAYVGGVLGTVLAVWRVVRARRVSAV